MRIFGEASNLFIILRDATPHEFYTRLNDLVGKLMEHLLGGVGAWLNNAAELQALQENTQPGYGENAHLSLNKVPLAEPAIAFI